MLYGIFPEGFLLVLSSSIGITMSDSTVASASTSSLTESLYSGVNASTVPYDGFYEQVRYS